MLNIYPTRLAAEKAELASMQSGSDIALLGNILPMEMLERQLAKDLSPRPLIGDLEKWLLLHKAVTEEQRAGKALWAEHLIKSDGFIKSLEELFSTFQLGLLSPEQLATITGYAAEKEQWISNVYARYQNSFSKGQLYDAGRMRMELLAALQKQGKLPDWLLREGELHLHSIYHFTPFRFELLLAIAQHMKVVIHFPLPDERVKAFGFVEGDIQKFQQLAGQEGLLEICYEEAGQSSPLEQFSANIFADDPKKQKPQKAVQILKNSSRYREVEEVAERIAHAHQSGTPLSSICVVFRNLEIYGSIVEEVFRRAGLPLYLRRGLPLAGNRYMAAILTIFQVIDSGYHRDEVAKLMLSDYFLTMPNKTMGASDMEALLMKAGIINGSPKLWQEKLAQLRKRSGKLFTKEGEQFIALLLKLLKTIEKLEKTKSYQSSITAWKNVIQLLPPTPINFGDSYFARDMQAKGRLEEILEEMEVASERHGISRDSFNWHDLRRLLTNALGNLKLPEWANREQVYALNVHELAGLSYSHLFICGMQDGEFPKKAGHGSILSEHEKREFNQIYAKVLKKEQQGKGRGRQIFTRLGETWEEESFLFYLATRAATQKLYLTYSSYDLGGKDISRSSFIEDVIATAPELEKNIISSKPLALEKQYHEQLDKPAKEAWLLRQLFNLNSEEAGSIAAQYQLEASHPESGGRFKNICKRSQIEIDRQQFYLEPNMEKRAAAETNYTGKIGSTQELKRFMQKVMSSGLSPTSLERYGDCPFKYFLEKPLGCNPLELPTAEVNAMGQGTLIHAALENYHNPNGKQNIRKTLPPAKQRQGNMADATKKAFTEYEEKNDVREPELWQITKEQVQKALQRYLKWEEESFSKKPFTVMAVEHSFGVKEKIDVEIQNSSSKVRFRGSIDRVDFMHDSGRLRVVDYKYSKDVGKFRKQLDEESFGISSFQMPIYMTAALKSISHFGNIPKPSGAEATYITLKPDTEEAAKKSKPTFFDDLANADKIEQTHGGKEYILKMQQLIKNMEGGAFPVTPEQCGFCQYRPICRYEKIFEMKSEEADA